MARPSAAANPRRPATLLRWSSTRTPAGCSGSTPTGGSSPARSTPTGSTSLAAPAPVPQPHDDQRVDVVATLLRDIATYTGRPLPQPIAAPPTDGHDEHIVVWVDNSYAARTPRQAAEQAWRTIRRPGSHACVLQVVNRRTGARVEIDLLDDEDDTRTVEAGSPA
jgi:hypothetical protein